MTFTVHLCEDCHKRASARTEGERGARLQAHLLSTLIALGLLVAGLAAGLVDVRGDLLVRILVIGMILIVGYGVPATVLLGRVGRQPPSSDAAFVRSTLVVEPEADGSEAAFAWRNPHYAQLFHQANRERAVGSVTPVTDLTT